MREQDPGVDPCDIVGVWRHGVKALSDAIPYQSLWHWLIENDFNDLERGSVGSIALSEVRLSKDLPDYVLRFLRILRDELRSEGISEDLVAFHIRQRPSLGRDSPRVARFAANL